MVTEIDTSPITNPAAIAAASTGVDGAIALEKLEAEKKIEQAKELESAELKAKL